jgi:D-cysteine desulfhydrase
MAAPSPSDLDAAPRLGWVEEPTPITPLPRLAEALGLEFLGIKRDDLLAPLHGGTKPRKLDYLLAAPPFAAAEGWASSGGIGSGSLVALTAAARKLDKKLRAHVFWTPLSAGVTDNLAFTASGAARLSYYGSRTAMALRTPSIVIGGRAGGLPVVPPGATSPRGMLGLVRAGLELCAQIQAGEIPEPERLYVALGSGGTAAGLAVGLALGGVRTRVVAVGVVERMLSLAARVHGLAREVIDELVALGLPVPEAPLDLVIERGHLGAAYAHVTEGSLAAVEALAKEGIGLEPIYTGKAMAALLDGAARDGAKRVLFWSTVRRALPEPDPAWREKLPPALRQRLEAGDGPRIARRRVLVGLAAVAAVGVAFRTSGYAPYPGFPGVVLSSWHAHVIRAAAEALLPDAPGELYDAVPARVDHYLATMPPKVKREVKGMLAMIEHGTTPLGGRVHRFTRSTPAEREAFLAGLEARGGLLSQAYRGLRDLVMLGTYQQPITWPALGYGGPWVPAERARMASYDALRAPEGALPKGTIP